jgi:hypothetical protein
MYMYSIVYLAVSQKKILGDCVFSQVHADVDLRGDVAGNIIHVEVFVRQKWCLSVAAP